MKRDVTRWRGIGIIATVLGLLTLLALTGCGSGGSVNREAALVGTWKLTSTVTPTDGTTNAAALQEFAKTVTLDLKADKSFTMNIFFQYSGNWTFNSDDGTLTLNTTKMGAVDITKMPGYNPANHKPQILKFSDDNSQLTMQPDASASNRVTSNGPLVFEKS